MNAVPPRPSAGERLRFRILGSLEVDRAEQPIPLGGPQQRAVLAHLIVRADELVPTDVLVSEIWGDEAPDAARSTIYTYVSHLRKLLGDDRIEGRTPGYRLRLDPSELDAARFDKLVNDARKAAVIDPGIAATVLDEALGLWRGAALADVADGGALLAEASRLDELRLVAGEERIDALLATGDQARVIVEAEILIGDHPLRERVWRQLMLALYREGRQAEALTAYQRVREVLADELGIDPSPELARLHERILRQDPTLELRGEPLRGYRLLEKIGEGPTGVVFRAVQPRVGRDVAIKIIHEQIASDPSFVRRFEPEAQAVAALEHPHIVPVYDYWREPGRAYIVSRYMKGGSLAAFRARAERPDRDGAAIVEQIASALWSAHRQQVAHGSVCAANVVFDGEGNAYLGDFRVGIGPDPDPDDDVRELASIAKDLLDERAPDRLRELVERVQLLGEAPGADAFVEAARSTSERETARAPRSDDVRNPYKGLRPFTEADAHDFFGRNELIARLIARLRETGRGSGFLAVVGPSGAGKSSVVRAGMVPAIRQGALGDPQACYVAEMFPGAHPIDELEQALVRIGTRSASRLHDLLDRDSRGLLEAIDLVLPAPATLVLVVDQFEEAFTLTDDEHERELFLESLRVAALDPESRVRVVLTLRADFYDRPLTYPRLGELLAARTEAVPPLTPDELEQAVRRPAEGVGITAEPGLVAEVIADVAHQPGALPLLQFGLTELFERRDDDRLTLSTYQKVGGIAGALSTRADRLFAATPPQGQRAIRQVFLRLVTIGEGRQDTRRRVARSELDALDVDPELVETVLDTYGRHRLLTFDREPATREPTVEIAHEALLTAWARLRSWIDDAREDLRQDRGLARAAGEWHASGRDPSFLLRGVRLEQIEGWAASTDLAIGRAEREYVKAGVDLRDHERADEEARRLREERMERRSRARLKALVAVFAAAALVASVLTLIAIDQRKEAGRRSRESLARELAAAAVAEIDVDPERSILLAMEAVEQTRSVDGSVLREAEEALHRAVVSSRIALSIPGRSRAVDWSSTGVIATTRVVSTGEPDERVVIDIRDPGTGEILRTIDGHPGEPADWTQREVAFSADGSMLATTGIDGKLDVWDPSTGELLRSVVRGGQSYGPSFSADGSLVAAIWDKGAHGPRIHVLDMSTDRMRTFTTDANDAALSPDGTRVAAATDVWLSVIDLETGKVVRHRGPGQQTYVRTSWSPDGRYVAMGGWHGEVPIWDTETWELLPRLPDVSAFSLDWSPDSSRLVTVGDDKIARVWSLADDDVEETHSLSAEGQGNWGVAFSPDGLSVATVGDPRALTTWDLGPNGDAEWANLAGVWDMRFAPTGHTLIAARGPDVALTTLDVDSGRVDPRNGASEPIPSWRIIGRDLSPDGGAIVVEHHTTGLYEPGRVTVRDAASGRVMFKVPGLVEWGGVRWAPDGRHLAVVRDGGNTSIVDRSWDVLRTIGPDLGDGPGEFSPDGRLIAMGWGAENVRIWDWEREELVRTIRSSADGFAFDRTGTRLATGGSRHKIWDVRSGRLISTLPAIPGEGTYALEFSPDGSRLAVGGSDTVLRLFDVATGRETLVLEGHGDIIGELAFSPDGSMLAARSGSEVRIWALDIGDLLEIAQGEVTRSLTDEECSQYLHVDRCPS